MEFIVHGVCALSWSSRDVASFLLPLPELCHPQPAYVGQRQPRSVSVRAASGAFWDLSLRVHIRSSLSFASFDHQTISTRTPEVVIIVEAFFNIARRATTSMIVYMYHCCQSHTKGPKSTAVTSDTTSIHGLSTLSSCKFNVSFQCSI